MAQGHMIYSADSKTLHITFAPQHFETLYN